MNEVLSTPTGPEAKSPVPVGEADASITGHEPSSHLHQAAIGQGIQSRSPDTVAWGFQNSFTPAMNSAKFPSENSLFGNSGAVSDNGKFLWGSEPSLADLIRSLRKGGGKKDISRKSRNVRRLLEQDPNIDVNELIDGQPILHDACRLAQLELLKVILKRPNVDVNIRDNTNSRTPLHVAAIRGDQDSINQLLDMDGIDTKAQDAEGCLPLHYAVERQIQSVDVWSSFNGNENDILLHFCGDGAVNTRNTQRRGPLHIASKTGNIAALKILLSQPDLEINMTDVRGETALHQAKDATVAGMLLEKSLNAHIQDVDGNTALHCALEQGSKELVSLLLKNTQLDRDMPNSEGEQVMHIAAAKWDLETFKQSVATPLSRDINETDGNGRTVLHIAARVGNMDIVEYLLGIASIAASFNAEDERGQTPLHLACENGHVDVVKRLLSDPSIGVNVRDKMRRTPLHLASEKGHPDVVHLLLDSTQVEADVGDVDGWTPIYLAANRGHFDTVLSLLEHGANPRTMCSSLLYPDGSIGQDAAGVADKIEIRNLIRRYRFRKISLVPNRLSKAQEDLFKRHGSGVYTFWKWPSKEDLPDEHSNVSRRKRQRNYPDISTVYRIYDRPVSKSRQASEPCEEEQWQLRHGLVQDVAWDDPWNIKDSKPRFISCSRQRTTKWVHFSAQNVSIIIISCPHEIFPLSVRDKANCRRCSVDGLKSVVPNSRVCVCQPLTNIVVQDFCRLMYSHESLQTEGVDILTFIDDTFDQGGGAVEDNEDPYREHCVKLSNLPMVTDEVQIPHIISTAIIHYF